MDNEFFVDINISILWDISDTGLVDSAGMMLFIHYYDLLKSNNCSIELPRRKQRDRDIPKSIERPKGRGIQPEAI